MRVILVILLVLVADVVTAIECGSRAAVVPIAPDQLALTIFLVGDAGLSGRNCINRPLCDDVVLRALQADVTARATAIGRDNVVVVYLGDNIYPEGLDPSDLRTVARLDAQVDVVRPSGVRAFFVPDAAKIEAILELCSEPPDEWKLVLDAFAMSPSLERWRELMQFVPEDLRYQRHRNGIRYLRKRGVETNLLFLCACYLRITPDAIELRAWRRETVLASIMTRQSSARPTKFSPSYSGVALFFAEQRGGHEIHGHHGHHLTAERIAEAVNGADVVRRASVIAEGASYFVDDAGQIGLADERRRPERVVELLPRQRARPRHEQ